MITNYQLERLADMVAERVAEKVDEIMSVETAAKFLKVAPDTLRARYKRGQVPGHLRHGRLFFSRRELTRFYLKD